MMKLKILNKLLRYPEKLPCDKRMHYIIGVVYMVIAMLFTHNLLILIPGLIILAWGIEWYQRITLSGDYDNYDALAVVAGGLTILFTLIKGN